MRTQGAGGHGPPYGVTEGRRRQTNPIFGVYGLKTRVRWKNEANLARMSPWRWPKPSRSLLTERTLYAEQGQFPAGSMGPKVEAVVDFFKATGNRGIICQLDDIEKAIAGKAGTEIIN